VRFRRLLSPLRRLFNTLVYSESLPPAWRRRRLATFWERQARTIHARWGKSREDVAVVGRILETYRPASVLDIGCGTGRLFGTYRQHGVQDITGIDISATALALARREYPDVATVHGPLQTLALPRHFDLILSNRVLQHIPRTDIGMVVERLCAASDRVYVNELSASDGVPEDTFMSKHDYEALFCAHGWQTAERGHIGQQTYLVLERSPAAVR
jgi:SAM-dependent methyltransferase